MSWMILIALIVAGAAAGDVCWQLRTIRKAVNKLRIEHHDWWLIQADEQAATATRAAIVGEKVAEIRKEVNDLYLLELTRTAGTITAGARVINFCSGRDKALEFIRDGAGPKVALDVAEAIQRAAEREENG